MWSQRCCRLTRARAGRSISGASHRCATRRDLCWIRSDDPLDVNRNTMDATKERHVALLKLVRCAALYNNTDCIDEAANLATNATERAMKNFNCGPIQDEIHENLQPIQDILANSKNKWLFKELTLTNCDEAMAHSDAHHVALVQLKGPKAIRLSQERGHGGARRRGTHTDRRRVAGARPESTCWLLRIWGWTPSATNSTLRSRCWSASTTAPLR